MRIADVASAFQNFDRWTAFSIEPEFQFQAVEVPEELEFWYQAQRAYAEKDVVALETILARCNRVGTNSRTLSELRELVMQANLRRATLRRSIDCLAELPSWRFLLLDSAEIKTRLRNVRRELEAAVRELFREANELARIGTRMDQWLSRRKGAEAQLAFGF